MIYIVDDDARLNERLERLLGNEGYECQCFADCRSVLAAVRNRPPELVLLDFILPDGNGIDVLRELKTLQPALPIVMMSGEGTIPVAVESLKLGAYDFLVKPLDANRVKATVRNAIAAGVLQRSVSGLKRELAGQFTMIGDSPAMQQLRALIAKVAPTDASVLITGESGVGKELVARALHLQSNRAAEPFVAINCAAIPEALLESELFGIAKRTATGVDERPGRLEQASRGTILLDEIGDMSLALQAKILRVLQTRELERVGGRELIPIDVRVIAATNQNLPEAIAAGRFREDLYYRLNVVPIEVPPLRERREDIPTLAEFFLQRFCARYNRQCVLSPDSLAFLSGLDWPGNVRELENVIERIVALAESSPVEPEELRAICGLSVTVGTTDGTLSAALNRAEREAVLAALQQTGGNITAAAQILGIERPSLHRIIKRLGLSIDRQ